MTIAATGAGGTTPYSATAGSARGGPGGSGVGAGVRALARMEGRGLHVGLPGGGSGAPCPDQGRGGLAPGATPLPRGTSGLLVQLVGAHGADVRLTWRAGCAAYAVRGHVKPGLLLAESLVRAGR